MIVLYQDLFPDRLKLLLHYTIQAWISCKKRLEIEYIPYRKPPGSPLQGHYLGKLSLCHVKNVRTT
jgi:hypothetical protein